jgi:Ca2+-transporting ATPase
MVAFCSEPLPPGLTSGPPQRRDKSILTRPMATTIFSTAAFFVVVMMLLLVGMQFRWPPWLLEGPASPGSPDFPGLTVWHVSVLFTTYAFFQVWNLINCRSLAAPEVSGFRGLSRDPTFLAVAALTVLGQVLIVTFGGRIFQVAPLRLADWLAIAAGTASVLLFAGIARRGLKGSFAKGAKSRE